MEIRFYLCFLELKNPIPEIKNLLNRLNSRLDTAEDKSNELEDIIIETIQTEARGGKKWEENQLSLTGLWDIIKQSNKHVIGVAEGKGGGTEKVFEEIVAESFPNVNKTVSPQIYKVQKTPDRINKENHTKAHHNHVAERKPMISKENKKDYVAPVSM